ncbi:hypothetical protein BK673_16165 [Pseudomonas fluorescens]|uniref:Uncharacterized protein n=1 Tax=Pseudomonas fluorescens TaxID=294 RepID=A0A423P4C9_PSEFL|nr:hypothetical protein [Pseudomonas fluorescens]ROO08074.1 hypothetical protein BK673_16165 [Pseudomonas fluorescens]
MSKQIEKIKIQGVPPAWDDSEYLRRLDMEIHMYRNTTACLQMVRAPLEFQFLNLVIEYGKSGYTINTNQRISHDMHNHTAWMNKPDAEQAADIEALRDKVKDEYTLFLQAEHQRYQGLLREQLLQADEEKQRLQREKEEAKKIEAINKQVEQCYSPLVIPDDIPEHKAAVFSTDM